MDKHKKLQSSTSLDKRSIDIRTQIIKVLQVAGRGHIGAAFSLVEILRVLYDQILIYDPLKPQWHKRDRFVLSKGHGCIALYAILAEKGFFPENELWKFCSIDGILGGHPEIKVPGIEASTGSLGHGLSIGNGFALNARLDKSEYRTFVVIGDGESNEGSIWEAALFAGKHQLSNLTVIVDYNKHQSYGPTSYVQELDPLMEKWSSFGFAVSEVDGHNIEALKTVFSNLPFSSSKPNAIICNTVKGKGIPLLENNMEWHHKSRVKEEEIQFILNELKAIS